MSFLFGVVCGVIALLGYGLSDFLGAISSRKTGVSQTLMLSRWIAVAMLLVFFLFIRIPQISAITLVELSIAGLFFAAATASYYRGFEVGIVSIISPVGEGWGVIVLALSVAFLNVHLGGMELAGVALVVVGTMLTSIKLEEIRGVRRAKLVKGVEYGFIAMFAFSMGYFMVNFLVRELGWFLPIFSVTLMMALSSSVYCKAAKVKNAKIWPILGLVAAIGILDAMANVAYGIGAVSKDMAVVAPIACASTSLIVLLALMKFKERLDINHKIGIAAVMVGIIMLSI
jgi:uncharacterized membrane protein